MNTPIAVLLSHKGSAVFSVGGRDTVADAVCEMTVRNVGSVVVIENGRLIGLLTERDVLTRVVAAGRQPDLTWVADVMTRHPVIVSPRTTVEEVMGIFTDKRCRQLPVIDDETDRLVGLISIGDVTRWLVESQRHEVNHLRQYISGGYSS
ncbi:MAG: CBS domain-containing protein [Nibricoccus sp.]